MAEAFLGPQARDHFFVGVQSDAVLFEVLAADLAPQIQDTVRLAVAVITRIPRGLGKFLDDDIFRWIRRVSHTQVDHVVSGAPLLVKQVIDAAEHVGR